MLDYAPTRTTASQPYAATWNTASGPSTVFERARFTAEDVMQHYVVTATESVGRFLSAYNFLNSFLVDALEPLHQYFPDHSFQLSIQSDPDSGVENLLLSIDIQNDPDAALEALDQLDAGWWFNVSPKIRDLVLLTLSAGN